MFPMLSAPNLCLFVNGKRDEAVCANAAVIAVEEPVGEARPLGIAQSEVEESLVSSWPGADDTTNFSCRSREACWWSSASCSEPSKRNFPPRPSLLL